jgi:hypothetical protein
VDKGSALEDTARQRAVVAGLCALAVALVAVAWIVDSYVPLFFVWAPQLAIPVYLARSSRRWASGLPPASPRRAPAVA